MFSTSINYTDLLALAPTALENARSKRYHGDDLAVPMTAFVPADRALIVKLYSFLNSLFGSLQGEDPARERTFQGFLDQQNIPSFVSELKRLGSASYEATPTPALAQTIHDVRGGGLTPLLSQLELWTLGIRDLGSCDSLYFLTRDHLKIMRNALLGLDDARRNEDLQIKVHGTDFIVEKWNGARFDAGNSRVRLEVYCPKPVAISECCVEFGALDRILYNLLNNACRHSADESIQLALFPIPDEGGENLRFVLLNALKKEDHARLRGMDMQTLFEAGVSSTGSGYGLNVAAEFVAHAFGLGSPADAVAGRYLGAGLLSDQFVIWFHWPIVAEAEMALARS